VSINHILELPAADRVAIVQEIWDSILEDPEQIEISTVQREELERRWIDLQQNPDDGEDWDDVKKSLRDE
jgi:putative addiction module component (TIGR02574 family)